MRMLLGLFSMAAMTGCDPLAGTYAGTVACDGDEVFGLSVQLDFEGEGEGIYYGTGRIGYLECATTDTDVSVDCELRFDMDVELDKRTGEQDLQIDYSECRYAAIQSDAGDDQYDFDMPPTDCRDQTEEVSWDGKDSISWKRFWAPDVPCVGKLKRQ